MPGIPGAQRVDHVALTVSDLDEAVRFTVDVLGGELIYRLPPLSRQDNWMQDHLDVPPGAAAEIALVRLGPVTNLELFRYVVDDQNRVAPGRTDVGCQHIGLYVTDVAAAAAALTRLGGARAVGPIRTAAASSPVAGSHSVRFRTPWGLELELRSMPAVLPYHSSTTARRCPPSPYWTNHDTNHDDEQPLRPPLPGLRSVDHLGYVVADLDAALGVFVDVLGGELLHRSVEKPDDEPVAEKAAVRLGPTDTVELTAYPGSPAGNPPRNCDVGGRHLAIHVQDVDQAAQYLAGHAGFTVLGQPETIDEGPIAGDRWVYVRSPIGLHIEVVRMPDGALPYERTTTARRRAAGALAWYDR